MAVGRKPRGAPAAEWLARRSTRVGDCLIYDGYKDRKGYSKVRDGGRMRGGHRVAFEAASGKPIPDGLQVDHTCHNRACVEPQHLRLVTNKQNSEHRRGAQSNNHSSGARGVSWNGRLGKWQVSIKHNQRQMHGGYFLSLEEARIAARELRLQLFTHSDKDREVVA